MNYYGGTVFNTCAGFQVSTTSLTPSEKMVDSISQFPTHKDISEVSMYFGLINQVAYAFAMTEVMRPFRHLLSPKTPFAWTPELDELFEKSKEVIVDKVTEGIRLFDPNLTTCLATDLSGKVVGFRMLQKTSTVPPEYQLVPRRLESLPGGE